MTEPLPELPPPSERQGSRGHDQAVERGNAIQLLTWRAERMTYAEIAEKAGYANASGARQALIRALDRHEAENVQELRTLENLALDRDELTLSAIITNTSLPAKDRIAAINARTRLSARRSRLNGLDAPMQLQVSSGAEARIRSALADARTLVLGLVGEDGVATITDMGTEEED